MGAIAYEDEKAAAERPPWGATIWAVFLGYAYTLFFVGLPLALLSWVNVVPIPLEPSEPGPWAPRGAWSIAADGAAFVLIALVASWFVHGAVSERFRRPVSPLVVLGAVAVTGYAPFLYYRWIGSSFVALLGTAAVIRYLAIDRYHSLGLGRRGLVAGAVLVVLAALTAGSYAYAHPIGLSESGGGEIDGKRYVTAELRNGGLGDLRIVGFESAEPVSRGWPPAGEPLLGAVVPARSSIDVSFSCDLDAVVRYELAGRTFEQRLTLDRC